MRRTDRLSQLIGATLGAQIEQTLAETGQIARGAILCARNGWIAGGRINVDGHTVRVAVTLDLRHLVTLGSDARAGDPC